MVLEDELVGIGPVVWDLPAIMIPHCIHGSKMVQAFSNIRGSITLVPYSCLLLSKEAIHLPVIIHKDQSWI